MSDLELKKFHSFLEGLIEDTPVDQRFSVDKVIAMILSLHSERLEKVQGYVNDLGLRALIRNNCRAKTRSVNLGPDLFGQYRIGKLVSVPYLNENGKLRWDKKRRGELSFDELDEVRKRLTNRPVRQSKEQRDFDSIAERTDPYRNKAKNIGEALKMAEQEGR
ncbi:hypothetical protein [Mesorhizobium sp. NPDC059025]|uniref:hypothetical protein n=1 Tax=unclassified Mesorhizobium TaxID=325217 RepID=UPI0036795D50